MNDFGIVWRGIAAGLIISAPVGPVNILCISRTLAKGRIAGAISGLGAASADTLYGAVAGFSLQFVIGFLLREEFWIRLIGGALLMVIGILYYFRRPRKLKEGDGDDGAARSDYVTAFLLNLTNPTTILSFLAVLTALGLQHGKSWWQGCLLIAGIFAGAMAWWLLLAGISSHFQDRINDRTAVWMNRVAGIAIGGFGIATMAMSHAKPAGL